MNPPTSQSARRTLRPYPGLRAFERTESRIFFGRGQQVDQLLSRLKQHHFLAVLGTSGSGKSSLMRAGVLPALEKGYMGEVGARWAIAEMKPGDQPFLHLAEALLNDKGFATAWQHDGEAAKPAILAAELRRGARSVHEIWAGTPIPEGTRLLLLVDQFEEMFRYREREENQAAAFVALLLEACQHPDIYVAITMRSDFLGTAAAFHGLPEVINSGLYLTPRLTRDQLHEAITLPAQLFGGTVDEALANYLQNEAGNDPDQLPLLQHALMRMWDSGEDKSLTLARYQGMNGLRGVLDKHAEQAWAELDASQQIICEAMFRALTERSRDGQYIRRPVKVQAVMDLLAINLATLNLVIDAFRQAGRNFLMPPPQVPLMAETMLDISHESLIRHWQRLKDWVTAESEKALMYQRLLDAAQRHTAGKSELWHGTDLALALEWQEKTQPTTPWAMRYFSSWKGEAEQLADNDAFLLSTNFLTASATAQRQLQKEAEDSRKCQLKRARRQLSYTLVGLVIALTTAGWGWSERNHALVETAKATQAKKEALLQAKNAVTQRERAELAEKKAHLEAENAKLQGIYANAAAHHALLQSKKAQYSEKMAKNEATKAKKAIENTQYIYETLLQSLLREDPEMAINFIKRVQKSKDKSLLRPMLLEIIKNTDIGIEKKIILLRNIETISDTQLDQLITSVFNKKTHDLAKTVDFITLLVSFLTPKSTIKPTPAKENN